MPKVKFETGEVVNFSTAPTQQDIEEVAQKLKLQKQVSPPPKSSAINTTVDVGVGVGKGGLKTAKDSSDIVNLLSKYIPDSVKDTIRNQAITNPTLLPVLAAFEATSVISPQISKIEQAKGLQPGQLTTPTNTAQKVGYYGEKVGELVGVGGVQTLGKVTSKAGEKLFSRSITPTVQEAEKILAYKAKTPFLTRISNWIKGEEVSKPNLRSTTALEKGIVGTESQVGIQAKRQADKLWTEKVAPTVEASTSRVSKEEMFAPIQERIAKTIEPGKKKALQETFDAIQEDYSDVVDFSLKDAQRLKSELDKFTPEKIFKGKNVANEYQTLKNDMANAIRQKTYSSLEDVNIKKDYLDWANLNELQKIGVKAISEAGTKGGYGGFWTSAWNMATTPVKTIGGQVLYRVGNKLEFVGPKGIKKFGQYLGSKGFKAMTDVNEKLK